jgi:hypothetical protein
MHERRLEQAVARWRAIALGLMGLLVLSVSGGILRAGAPATGQVCAATPLRVAEPVRALPPEWRWTPSEVSLDRMYGTPAGR